MRSIFHGLWTGPKWESVDVPPWPNSSRLVLPMMIAPAACNLSTRAESVSGIQSARIFDPPVVRTPAVSNISLIVTGTPCSGPRCCPRAMSSSAFFAAATAGSRRTVMKALSLSSSRSSRARAALTASADDSSRDAISQERSVRFNSQMSAEVMIKPFCPAAELASPSTECLARTLPVQRRLARFLRPRQQSTGDPPVKGLLPLAAPIAGRAFPYPFFLHDQPGILGEPILLGIYY